MGAGAGLAIFMKLMESEKGREIMGKIPLLGQLVGMFGDAAVDPVVKQALTPATPEQQLVNALTVISGFMPAGEESEKFKSAISLILDGVSNLKASMAKEKP